MPAANVIARWASDDGPGGDVYGLKAALAVHRLLSTAVARKSGAGPRVKGRAVDAGESAEAA